jgi:hypothetical protein
METGGQMGLIKRRDKFAEDLIELCQKNGDAYWRARELDGLADTIVAYELKRLRRYHRVIGFAVKHRFIPWLLRRYRRLLSAERRLDAEAAKREITIVDADRPD